MTSKMTDLEKITSLQTDLLYQKAEYDKCPTVRFVAWMAFCSDEPILTLRQLARRKHASLPDIGGEWIRKKAKELLIQLLEAER